MQDKAVRSARAAKRRIRKHRIRNICVYCGSGAGANPAFATAASEFGQALAENDIGLVFGGGGRGLMGEVARAALRHGGHVVGVIPRFLIGPEHALQEVDELVITESMHERKLQMFERSDAFVALPGGIGTLEEFVEQLTWNQIGQHNKPLVLANVLGYWDPLVALFDHMLGNAFIRPGLEVNFHTIDDIHDIIPTVTSLMAEQAEVSGPDRPVPVDKL
jgi:uncharacterized protein (TIGR00730 family)